MFLLRAPRRAALIAGIERWCFQGGCWRCATCWKGFRYFMERQFSRCENAQGTRHGATILLFFRFSEAVRPVPLPARVLCRCAVYRGLVEPVRRNQPQGFCGCTGGPEKMKFGRGATRQYFEAPVLGCEARVGLSLVVDHYCGVNRSYCGVNRSRSISF